MDAIGLGSVEIRVRVRGRTRVSFPFLKERHRGRTTLCYEKYRCTLKHGIKCANLGVFRC